MANLPVEIKFAQNLASNEKKIRFKALKKLKKYLIAKSSSNRGGFTEEDLLKLWKGLHYCMWMQDKPLIQEELSSTITQLVHILPLHVCQLFVKTFFLTEAREWNGLDVWRLDKFMMLVRNMLCESLLVLKKLNWDNECLDALMSIYGETVMNPASDTIPDGLKIHFSDIYLDEVERIGAKELTGSHLVKLLTPFITFIQHCKNTEILKRTISRVFEPIIERAAKIMKQAVQPVGENEKLEVENEKSKELETDETEKVQDTIPYISLQFDNELLADHLFMMGQQETVLSRNRPFIYKIVTRLKDIEKGVLNKSEIVIDKGFTHNDIQNAVQSLVNVDLVKKKRKHKKKSKNQVDTENTDPNSTEPKDVNASVIKGKRKHAMMDEMEKPFIKLRKKEANSNENMDDAKSVEKKGLHKLKRKLNAKNTSTKSCNVDEVKGSTNVSEPSSLNKTLTSSNELHDKSDTITCADDIPADQANDMKCLNTIKGRKNKLDCTIEPTTDGKASIIKDKALNKKLDKKSALKAGGEKSWTIITGKTESTKIDDTNSNFQAADANCCMLNTKKSYDSKSSCTPVEPVLNLKTKETVSHSKQDVKEEYEIFVPNKKYKKVQRISQGSSFAKFELISPPMAYVKKSASKCKKMSNKSSTPITTDAKIDSAKRVSFDMKKNRAQAFKDSLLISPETPFNPLKKPEQSILKSPPNTDTSLVDVIPGSHSMTTSFTPTNSLGRSHLVSAKKQNKWFTPTNSLGRSQSVAAKKQTSAKRMKAEDFFL